MFFYINDSPICYCGIELYRFWSSVLHSTPLLSTAPHPMERGRGTVWHRLTLSCPHLIPPLPVWHIYVHLEDKNQVALQLPESFLQKKKNPTVHCVRFPIVLLWCHLLIWASNRDKGMKHYISVVHCCHHLENHLIFRSHFKNEGEGPLQACLVTLLTWVHFRTPVTQNQLTAGFSHSSL